MRLALTLGDPAGIGPEVSEAALGVCLPETPELRVRLFGPRGLADSMAERLGPRVTAEPGEPFAGPVGEPTAASGRAALEALYAGIACARREEVDALVTAPISKHALSLAGCADPGHTPILARELGTGPVGMAFFADTLRVVLATEHLSMRRMLEALSAERVVEVSRLLHQALARGFGVTAPRLGLAALNPHAGEEGMLGDEESRILAPAVEAARAAGVELRGPFPADTVFRRALDGELDGVVALYHDQGLIPVKMLGLGRAAHVTLGLRLPRTSPDHGTAYDIAGSGKARPEGMVAAVRTAMRLSRAGLGRPARG